MQQFSIYGSSAEEAKYAEWTSQFISGTYLTVLGKAHYDVIYERLDVGEYGMAVDGNFGANMKPEAWERITQNTNMHEFDTITALSEPALNNAFHVKWTEQQSSTDVNEVTVQDMSLWRWKHDGPDSLEVTFDPLVVQVRRDGRATVLFCLQKLLFKPKSQPAG